MQKTKKVMKRIALILVILYVLACFEEPVVFSLLFVEAIVTAFYYGGAYTNLAKIINESEVRDIRSILLYGHTILILASILITPSIFFIDLLLVFPIIIIVAILNSLNVRLNIGSLSNKITIKCDICGTIASIDDSFCTNCGTRLNNPYAEASKKVPVSPRMYDTMYSKNEEILLEKFLDNELKKADLDSKTTLIPAPVLKRKNILNILFSILLFVYVSLIFFHFPIYTYIIGAIILLIFTKKNKVCDLKTYLKKEIKSRPSEKISNIIMKTKDSLCEEQKSKQMVLNVIAILASLIIFINPRIMYESNDSGYSVRFYTFGVLNFTKAEIPSTYKGKDVTSLRGNTFSNMPFLKEVKLPDTITEIRGQAFKNDKKLTKVNIPSYLEYLGGGTFYNCKSIKSIELPDTLTYLGGESFYNAKSLREIKLSENLTEIRGNTFENCRSLKSITIPDKVTRIGGHAFYGNSSLEEVIISENSELKEIGSSAFRLCSNLKSITIPPNVNVNGRAFKESPTKVNVFGYADVDTDSYYLQYAHNASLFFSNEGESELVNIYYKDAIINNTKLTLVKMELMENPYLDTTQYSYKFTFKYTDELGDVEFTLDKDTPYREINDNLTFYMEPYYLEHGYKVLGTTSKSTSIIAYFN